MRFKLFKNLDFLYGKHFGVILFALNKIHTIFDFYNIEIV